MLIVIQIITLILVIVVPVLQYFLEKHKRIKGLLIDKRSELLTDLYYSLTIIYQDYGNLKYQLGRLSEEEFIPRLYPVFERYEKFLKEIDIFSELVLKSKIFLDDKAYKVVHDFAAQLNSECDKIVDCFEAYEKLSKNKEVAFGESWEKQKESSKTRNALRIFKEEVFELIIISNGDKEKKLDSIKKKLKRHLSKTTL